LVSEVIIIDRQLLIRLTQLWGVSGQEDEVREFIRACVAPLADSISCDSCGNLIVLKKGTRKGDCKTILLAAHMDEVGLKVTEILADGRIRLEPLAEISCADIFGQTVVFRNGATAVIGSDIPVEKAENDFSKLFGDLACTTAGCTRQHIREGDLCGFRGAYTELHGNKAVSKSFDDRAGCAMLIEALRRNNGNMPNDVYYVFTVQEEHGIFGVRNAVNAIKPDILVGVDTTIDQRFPADLAGANEIGRGIGIKLGSPSAPLDRRLTDTLLDCCKQANIKYQWDINGRSGLNYSNMNLSQIASRVCGISPVVRNIHSPASMISIDDLEAGVQLIGAFTSRSF